MPCLPVGRDDLLEIADGSSPGDDGGGEILAEGVLTDDLAEWAACQG